jgi:signal transduction histidine kinase
MIPSIMLMLHLIDEKKSKQMYFLAIIATLITATVKFSNHAALQLFDEVGFFELGISTIIFVTLLTPLKMWYMNLIVKKTVPIVESSGMMIWKIIWLVPMLFLFGNISLNLRFNPEIVLSPEFLVANTVSVLGVIVASEVLYRTLSITAGVSELKRQQEETDKINATLSRLNRLKSNFLADISHEMKTPLTVMDVYAQLTKRHIKAEKISSGTIENLTTISEEAKRLALLVEQLLDIAAEKDNSHIRVKVSVQDIFSQVVALCGPIVAANKNKLDVYAEKDCPPVLANPGAVKQIFFNLAANANRHTTGGTVKISAEPISLDETADAVIFSVEDNGTGIPPHILDRVFERGVSGDGSHGLGLPICKEAVEAHGGTIGIESGELRIENGSDKAVCGLKTVKGTIVTFTLPIYKEEKQAKEGAEA